MKFTCSVEINLPIDKVITLYDNTDNLKYWQDGFVSYKHISGIPGEKDAQSEFIYKIGKRDMVLIETILVKDLPREFTGIYSTREMVNRMTNKFTSINESTTEYKAELEYTEFNGFIPKLMAKLLPGMFKKQTQKWLNQFKAFAEAQ